MSSAASSSFSQPPSSGSSPNATTALEGLRTTIQKRITTFGYLREAHEGRIHWFNTVLLTREDLHAAFEHSKMKSRTLRFAILGMSLSSLLDIPAAHDFLRGLLSLLQEFDSVSDDNFDNRKNQRSLFKGTGLRGRKSGNGSINGGALPEAGDSYLFTPNIPFEMDYFQVLYTTCDMLVETYRKILSYLGPPHSPNISLHTPIGFPQPPLPTSSSSMLGAEKAGQAGLSPSLIEVVLKIDTRLKKLITAVTKDVDGVARSAIKEELNLLGGGDWSAIDSGSMLGDPY